MDTSSEAALVVLCTGLLRRYASRKDDSFMRAFMDNHKLHLAPSHKKGR